ncbi:MAG TPA: hypothetical protein ENN89_05755 [Synergistetes bacterium]|nr:hypothetical protein [Synergistota bacterium]
MKGFRVALIVCCVLLLAVPASANVIDISGPWILEFPQGQGLAVLQNLGGTPPTYQGQVTIPYPANSSGKLTFNVKMLTAPNYVIPGNIITFQPTTVANIGFFLMNLSSSSNGIAWIMHNAGSENYIINLAQERVPAHR